MKTNVIVKGRERVNRGQLLDFYDLPLTKQNNFLKIKETIQQFMTEPVIVYVYGSFHHGYWDEESDYDVIVSNSNIIPKIDEIIKEKYGFNTNIFFTNKQLSRILIP